MKNLGAIYKVLVQFKGFRHCFEVCAADVPAACRAVKKLIAENEDYAGKYSIIECTLYR